MDLVMTGSPHVCPLLTAFSLNTLHQRVFTPAKLYICPTEGDVFNSYTATSHKGHKHLPSDDLHLIPSQRSNHRDETTEHRHDDKEMCW